MNDNKIRTAKAMFKDTDIRLFQTLSRRSPLVEQSSIDIFPENL